ncbi:MAG: ABC-F family ATP-binding cassette domain-containing protein [Deltaproteobacteria bacterium]|nr:ABC-F family ATP-binding cassette domain-containing protein [Deltaproteobacteria bacterium]
MIDLVQLEKSYGDRVLFDDVSLKLTPGSRYGLVGANGSGKSTLLAILSGQDSPTSGEVIIPGHVRVGLLEQDRFLSDSQRIIDVAMMGDREVWAALHEQERLVAEASEGGSDDDFSRTLAELEERIRAHDGYTLRSRSGAVLEGLGIPAAQHENALSTLSGGFKLRVLLAQTLVGRPDLLLLDEPTNHLDILTIRWLEKFLAAFQGCAVVISHDHRFLDNVATHILDVDYETVTLYHGNYRRFAEEKVAIFERMEAEAERQQSIIDEKRAFIERFRSKATKARQAQSRAKQVEKLEKELTAPPQSSRRAPHFRFEQRRNSGQEVLAVKGLAKSYGDKRVLGGVSLSIRRGERIAVIGANGLGKSTLLKIATGRLAPDTGEATWGYEAHVGYFAQDHADLFDDPRTSVLDFLWRTCTQETTSFVRGQLGRMLFSGDDVDKPIATLSGGEAARLIFAKITVEQPNVLVLDEPTNHLDLESIQALVEALESYPGTLLFVSHDRWFVSRLATRIIELTADGLQDFSGTYDEYLAHRNDDHLDADAALARARKQRADERGERAAPQGNDWQEHKRRRSEHQKLLGRRDKVTAAIERAEQRLGEIRDGYCSPGFFENTPAGRVSELQAEETRLGSELDTMLPEWEQVEEELAGYADLTTTGAK